MSPKSPAQDKVDKLERDLDQLEHEKTTVEVDVDTDKATTGFGKFKSGIADAEGGFGKLKAAGKGAFDAIGPYAAQGAAVAGAAIAGFVVKAVGDFQELALGGG